MLSCLAIVAGLLERPTSTKALRSSLPMVGDRFTPELFVRAAARIGISARLMKRKRDEIARINLPCVLLLKQDGACVLTALDGDQAEVILPETGLGATRLPLGDLRELHVGLVLFAKAEYRFDDRTQDFARPPQKAWFWGTLARFWPVYAHAVLAALMINLFALAAPLFFMNVYDRVVPNNALETLWVLATGVFIVYGFDFVLRMARGYFVDDAGKNADVLLASRIFEHVLGMRYDARPTSTGAFAAILRDYETVQEFFSSATMVALADLPFIFLFIGVIWLLAGPIAIIPLAAVPIVVIVGVLVQIPLRRVVGRTMREGFQKHAIIIESLEGLEALKTSGAEGRAQRLWERFVGMAAKSAMHARFFSTLAINSSVLVQNLVSVLVLIYGVYQIAAGTLTTGALVACSILSGRAMAPLGQIAALVVRFHQSLASLRSLDTVMKMPLERPPEKTFLYRPRLQGQIEFRDVVFHYPNQKHAALHGVSFIVQPGERIGLIGRIGSGKSTIARLIAGLYQPTSGAILMDGTDMRQIDPADIRRNLGYTPQDPFLFFGSIKDNICLAMPHVDHQTILRAATIAGVDDFVKRHPEGYDMGVGENGRYLSGGERECVAIARALLLDPAILLLDEPTAAMDNSAEEHLKSRLLATMADRTLLLVTHRYSMLSLVDRLILVDGGRILLDGPKAKVLEEIAAGQLRVPQSA